MAPRRFGRRRQPRRDWLPRSEFDAFREQTDHTLDLQFKRIAQLQAQLDETLAASDKVQAQFLKLRHEMLVVRTKPLRVKPAS